MLKQLFHYRNTQERNSREELLSLRIGERHCSYAISDQGAGQLRELGYYTMEGMEINPVATLFASQPHLNEPYFKVLAAYDFPQSAMVPHALFDKDHAEKLLNNLYGVNGSSLVITEPVKDWGMYNVYAVPRVMHQWMKSRFHAGHYWHQYSIGLRQAKAGEPGGHLLVDLRSDDFLLMAAAGGKLLLSQTFVYSTPEDVLFYLLKTCQQFGLSQRDVKLELSGLIEKNSALYKELYQYFLHVSFRDAAWTMADSEYPAHYFTSLNDLARCVS